MKRRLFSFLLVAALCMGLCAAVFAAPDISGRYEATSCRKDGVSYSSEGEYLELNADGTVTQSQLTYSWLLDERARELWTENWRRSDLVRFGCYTKGYNWDFKGYMPNSTGDAAGKDVDDKYNVFPIPQDDVRYNPNIKQNPDYE